MREIVLDTETTGLDPSAGHRVVEIGAVEIVNLIPSGQIFHRYFDPERDMPEEAFRVHGLSEDFLRGKPRFGEAVEEFLHFIGDAPLVIHNAEFDVRFLSAELERAGRKPIPFARAIDTLALARRRNPGSPASLDALCARYRIDNSRRTRHGALLDAEILAEVYAELSGGRQTVLSLASASARIEGDFEMVTMVRSEPLPSQLSAEEQTAHYSFIESLGAKALWLAYMTEA